MYSPTILSVYNMPQGFMNVCYMIHNVLCIHNAHCANGSVVIVLLHFSSRHIDFNPILALYHFVQFVSVFTMLKAFMPPTHMHGGAHLCEHSIASTACRLLQILDMVSYYSSAMCMSHVRLVFLRRFKIHGIKYLA